MTEVGRDGLVTMFRQTLKDNESDAYYATKSNFFFAPAKITTVSGDPTTKFTLTVTAHRAVEREEQTATNLVRNLLG